MTVDKGRRTYRMYVLWDNRLPAPAGTVADVRTLVRGDGALDVAMGFDPGLDKGLLAPVACRYQADKPKKLPDRWLLVRGRGRTPLGMRLVLTLRDGTPPEYEDGLDDAQVNAIRFVAARLRSRLAEVGNKPVRGAVGKGER